VRGELQLWVEDGFTGTAHPQGCCSPSAWCAFEVIFNEGRSRQRQRRRQRLTVTGRSRSPGELVLAPGW